MMRSRAAERPDVRSHAERGTSGARNQSNLRRASIFAYDG